MTGHGRVMAPAMGLAMGAMVPAMAHGPMVGAGAAFVLAHVAVAAALGAAALVLPAARRALARHRPSRAMGARMALGAAAGFALVCAHCLATWHGAA